MMRRTKRRIEIEKRETKQQRSVTCSKRRKTVFSKASDLCRHGGANIGAFVTSPAEDSDLVYSFSGFSSSALDMADFYLNGKSPPPKLGFWWVDPNLYRYCNHLSEIHLTEDHLERMEKDFTARLEKKENPQSVSDFDQNPTTTSSQDEPSSSFSSSQIVSDDFDQNPSGFVFDFALSDISDSKFVSFGQDPNYSSSLHDIYGGPSSQNPSSSSVQGDDNESGFWESLEGKENPQSVSDFDQKTTSSSFSSSHQIVSDFDQNPSGFVSDFALASSPSDISNSKFASFGQDPNCSSSSLHDIYAGSSSQIVQNPSSSSSIEGDDNESGFWGNLIKEDVFGLNNELWETQDENNNDSLSLTRETQTEPVVNVGGYDDEMSFWDNNLFRDDGLGLNNNSLANEEDDYLIDISQFLNEEEIDLLQSGQFVA